MSSCGLTLLLTLSFTLFARVTSYVPPWIYNEDRFLCKQVCSEYLMGQTYSCFSSSGFGLAAGSLIVRVLPNFEWRYYGIHEAQFSKDFCRHIVVADDYYSHGNKSVCNPFLFRGPNHMKTRSSGAEEKTEVTKMEKLVSYLGKITSLAKEIQKEAMVADEASREADLSYSRRSELSDEKTKRIFPLLKWIAKIISAIAGLFSHDRSDDVENIFNDTYDYKRSYSQQEEDQPKDTEDSRSDAICYWILKDMCRNKQIMVCVNDVCCWETLNTDTCYPILNDNAISVYHQSIRSIIQDLHLEKGLDLLP